MQIDINSELAARPLTIREKIALYVLFMIFAFIIPAQYSHQVKEQLNEIRELMGLKAK